MYAFSLQFIAHIKNDYVQFKQEIKHTEIIGENVFDTDEKPMKTQWFTVHYGSKGFHLVPLYKKEWL